MEQRLLLRVLFAANRNGKAVDERRGASLAGGECVRRSEWARTERWGGGEGGGGRGSSWHARSTWLRAGSPPRPDPRDFQDIRHTRGSTGAGVNQLEPLAFVIATSTSCVVPFRLDAKLSYQAWRVL